MADARETFVARFGEAQADAIENAAKEHFDNDNGLGKGLGLPGPHMEDDFGSQPFRYWFLLAIARQCVTKFRDHHGITAPEAEMRAWALNPFEGALGEHDGSIPDFIAIIAGAYDGWVVEGDFAHQDASEHGDFDSTGLPKDE